MTTYAVKFAQREVQHERRFTALEPQTGIDGTHNFMPTERTRIDNQRNDTPTERTISDNPIGHAAAQTSKRTSRLIDYRRPDAARDAASGPPQSVACCRRRPCPRPQEIAQELRRENSATRAHILA